MNREQLNAYVDSIPPEVRARLIQEAKPLADYLARAHDVRERLRREFPNLNPSVRALVSLLAARVL
jgi:hypothetical protein